MALAGGFLDLLLVFWLFWILYDCYCLVGVVVVRVVLFNSVGICASFLFDLVLWEFSVTVCLRGCLPLLVIAGCLRLCCFALGSC